jgi:hypothetical protein
MVTPDDLPSDVHGGADPTELARLGLRPEQILDFSANVNPFGPSPAVKQAVQEVVFDRYPDRMCIHLRRELAARHGVAEEQVLIGNGSSELIWLVAVALVKGGDRVVVLGPTFSGYERSARLMGAKVVTYRARAEDDFRPPYDSFARGIEVSTEVSVPGEPEQSDRDECRTAQVFKLPPGIRRPCSCSTRLMPIRRVHHSDKTPQRQGTCCGCDRSRRHRLARAATGLRGEPRR